MNQEQDTDNYSGMYGQGIASNNEAYVTASTLKIRLDTSPIIAQIELFLRGYQTIIEQDDMGNIKPKRVITGIAKANDEGVQGILNYVTAVFNPQVVQGNYTMERYEMAIEEINIDLAKMIVYNCYNWGIKEDDIDLIINFIM